MLLVISMMRATWVSFNKIIALHSLQHDFASFTWASNILMNYCVCPLLINKIKYLVNFSDIGLT
jgi:hypothetical protein